MPLTSKNTGDQIPASDHNEIYNLLKTTTDKEWVTWAHKGADIASAGTLSLGNDGSYFDVTGTTGITAISSRQAGTMVILQFDGAVTLTHSATLVLQGAANVTTAAGDILVFIADSSTVWRQVGWLTASGFVTLTGTQTLTNKTLTSPVINTGATGTGIGASAGLLAAGDHTTPAATATVAGHVPTPPNNTTTFLRGDMTFAAPSAASGGTPALVLGTTNAAGAAATFIRDDDTILVFDTTAPAAVGTAAVGTATTAARRDHVHAVTPLTNSLGGDVAITSANTFFVGPTVAQGTSGTWLATGTVTLIDSSAANNFTARLWDGTTTIASGLVYASAIGGTVTISLSGYIASPAGNLRISVASDLTTGVIKAATPVNPVGNNASTISVIRIA